MQTKSQHDVKQEENSCTVHEKEPNNLQQKHYPESGNHASKFDEVSPSSKQDVYDVQKKQSSGARNDALESHEEEKIGTYMKGKDPDMLMQKQISNPGITSQESNPPVVSHLMKDEKAVEKLQPRRNLESGVNSLQSDKGSIPSKVPEDASKISNDEPDSLNLKQNPDSGVQTSEMCDGEKTNGKRERTSDILLPVESSRGQSASPSDKLKLNYLTRPEKTVKKLHPRRNPETGGRSSKSDQVTDPLSERGNLTTIPKEPKPNNLQPTQCLDVGNHALTIKEEKCASERQTNPGNLVQASSLSIGVPVSQSDPENFTYSKRNQKVEKLQPRRNPDPVVQGSQSVVQSTPTKIPDKGLNEGYNWRKYGQKLVKGNKFIRSYYRCTYPNCQAKKQVERSHDGCKTEVYYLGRHHHPKPQHSPQVSSAFHDRVPEIPVATVSKSHAELIIGQGGAKEQGVTTETSCQSTVTRCDVTRAVSCSSYDNDKDGHPDSKRQQCHHDRKTEITSVDDKPNNDLRHVVQTLSEVDMVNDGYRWRKYGQKLVKGNPNPRSYYRCSNAGCPAKKHVERASHDSKMVITTYEGHHNHDIPPSRTVNQSTTRGDANMTAINGEPKSKPQENNSVALETVVHASAN